MGPEIGMFLVFILMFLVVIALFVIIGVGVVVLIVWMVRRVSIGYRKAGEVLAVDAEQYFAETVPGLHPWSADALPDISSHLERVGRSALGSIHYRGTLKSLKHPDEAGYIAFDLQVRRTKGPMAVRTSTRTLQLDIQGSSARVSVEGSERPLGSLREQNRLVTILDADDNPIGKYTHKPPGFRFVVLGYQKGYFDPAYGPLELRGRALAEINNNMILTRHLPRLDQPIPPLLQNLAPDFSREEEDWLLALIGLEMYYRIAKDISDRSR